MHRRFSWVAACSEDARVALLESVFVALVLHTVREIRVEPALAATEAPPRDSVLGGWAQLDVAACSEDARVALLESVFVALVLHTGREIRVEPALEATEAPPRDSVLGGWAQLDEVDLQEELLNRVPMLKSCPHFLRGRMRECFAVALRERHCAKLAGEVLCQTRAWKLFCLVPKMLHRPRNTSNETSGHR